MLSTIPFDNYQEGQGKEYGEYIIGNYENIDIVGVRYIYIYI
jgi:hypothetical protein